MIISVADQLMIIQAYVAGKKIGVTAKGGGNTEYVHCFAENPIRAFDFVNLRYRIIRDVTLRMSASNGDFQTRGEDDVYLVREPNGITLKKGDVYILTLRSETGDIRRYNYCEKSGLSCDEIDGKVSLA